MNDTYHEQIVSKKAGAMPLVIKTITILALVLLLIISLANPLFSIVVIALGFFAFYYIFPRLSVEYEYSVLNSSFSVDVIFSKSSRKHLLDFDLKNVSRILPAEQFNKSNFLGYKVLDFSENDTTNKSFAIVLGNDANRKIILITPDEKIVNILKIYGPRGSF